MPKHDKLEAKLRRKPVPVDFRWDDLVTLMNANGFTESCSGGSHYTFQHHGGLTFSMSKTHPSGILKQYQVRDALAALDKARKP